jgi:transcriptional regulator with PAS, ATPase and Fis domain
VFKILLPPLRSAKEDLEELVPQFVAEYNAKANRQVSKISNEAWEKLKQHDWPGNVRELRNVIERCVLFAEDKHLPVQWLQLREEQSVLVGKGICENQEVIQLPLDGSMALDDMDSFIIKTALERADYNLTAAARALGTTRETLRYRVRKYQLKVSE